MTQKRWPFLESPGDFATRLEAAYFAFDSDMLAAVRNCLIENPPMLASAPAPAGGVDDESFYIAFEAVFEAYSRPADTFATDTAWAMFLSSKVLLAYSMLQKVRASLSPAPTSGSEAGPYGPRLAGRAE